MTKNHRYIINIVDVKTESIDGQPLGSVKDIYKIFDKDPKAVIQVIWPNMKNNNTKKKTTRRSRT